ncbi:MAG: DUF177 domain-containing protein [Candidatus Omnitrophota bacterium]
MKIKVRDISASGIEIVKDIWPKDLGLDENDFRSTAPLKILLDASRVGDTVLAKTIVQGTFSHTCVRCLEPVEFTRDEEYSFDYPVSTNMDTLDIGEDIRQELILGLPVQILCQDDCRGLCTKCGVNLNKEQCKCSK